MKRDTVNNNGDQSQTLEKMTSVKQVLAAVGDGIEHLLSRDQPSAAASNIPILQDVVSDAAPSTPVTAVSDDVVENSEPTDTELKTVVQPDEASADDRLSQTSGYKTLSDRDIERAARKNSIANNCVEDDNESELELDDGPIDDDMDFNFDQELENIDRDWDETQSKIHPEATASNKLGADTEHEDSVTPADNFTLPDMEALDVALGVEPLPAEVEPQAPQENAALAKPSACSLPGTLHEQVSQETLILTRGQLTQIIESVLDNHMLALQDALLQQLEPFVGQNSPDHN